MTLAQVFVSLDHLSKGHAILGIGAGERENTEPFGLDFSRPVSRLEEALVIIRMLWESDGKAINYDGHFWRLRDAVFGLPLYQGRAPRLFVGAHQPRMLRLTGKYGDGWLPSMKPTSGEYRQRLEKIYEAAAKADRSLENFTPCQLVPVAIGESREQMMEAILQSPLGAVLLMLLPDAAWQRHGLTHPLGEGHRGFDQIVPRRITPENIAYARSVMTPALVSSSVYVGGPRELVDQIAPVVDEGARHLIVSNIGFAFVKGGAKDLFRLARFIRALRKL
jgi:phthiodiolone/phenolphthiodiolone dimycocerosates ketoreductase